MSEEMQHCQKWDKDSSIESCQNKFYKSYNGSDYCIFHYPDPLEKSDEEVQKAFADLIENSNNDENIKVIDLRESNFGYLKFQGEIQKDIYLEGSCTLKGLHFDNVKFLGESHWEGCQLNGNIFFTNCHFTELARFTSCMFNNGVSFIHNRFSNTALFSFCEFLQESEFNDNKFYDAVSFKRVRFAELVTFHRTVFATSADFRLSKFFVANSNCSNKNCYLAFKNTDFTGADLSGLDLSGVDLSNACLKDIKYNKKGNFKGINAASAWGNMQFRRFAMDQAYIEEFKEEHPRIYFLWDLSSNCGRSILWWTYWSFILALLFSWIFLALGEGAFHIKSVGCEGLVADPGCNQGLGYSFGTMLYYSIVTFTTLGFGDVTPLTYWATFWVAAEVIVGYVMLGGLISILANKLSRRAD